MSLKGRILFSFGLSSILISALPWFGLGAYGFYVPRVNVSLPRLHLLETNEIERIYEPLTWPLRLVALIPPLDLFVYVPGAGRAIVLPFNVFLFYFILGVTLLWIAVRSPSYKFRLSFGLRTLFVLVTLFAFWLGYDLSWVRQRREALESGHVQPWSNNKVLAPAGLWLLGERGEPSIRVDGRLSDAELARLQDLFPEAIHVPSRSWRDWDPSDGEASPEEKEAFNLERWSRQPASPDKTK